MGRVFLLHPGWLLPECFQLPVQELTFLAAAFFLGAILGALLSAHGSLGACGSGLWSLECSIQMLQGLATKRQSGTSDVRWVYGSDWNGLHSWLHKLTGHNISWWYLCKAQKAEKRATAKHNQQPSHSSEAPNAAQR